MADKDRGTKPQPKETLPADEELDESPEDLEEADEEFEEEPQAAAPVAAIPASTRPARAEAGRRPLGSVRESHERVKIDDRLSAAFAILCAIALVGVLVVPWVGGFIPKPVGPTLTPLVLPTYQITPTPVPTPTVAPTPTPVASPSASPSK